MNKNKFSIGYNNDIKMLQLLDSYKDNIESVYFSMPYKYAGSGRMLREPDDYGNQVIKIIQKCGILNIASQLLLNATCEGERGFNKYFIKKILNYIKSLQQKGLSSIIVTNPFYISLIKKEIPGIRVESSVNCFVKTLEHALYLKELGADVITIDRDINRDIPLISKIKQKTGLKIRIMLNEGCLSRCPYRITHYNYLAHTHKPDKRAKNNLMSDMLCMQLLKEDPSRILLSPFIPPDELIRYEQCADYYKLSTRVFSTSKIKLCLDEYIKGSFNGNLLDILD
jgi:collagenase-like PrtC family protease